MKIRASILIAAIIAAIPCLLAHSGCARDPAQKLNSAIDRYREKESGSFEALERDFIEAASIDSVRGSTILSTGSVLYTIREHGAKTLRPFVREVSTPGDEVVSFLDIGRKYCAVSDGIQLAIYDESGNLLNNKTVGDPKKPLKALLINGDDVLYFKNFRINRYSIINSSSDQLISDTFDPPYANYYSVRLQKAGDLVCVLAGIAGTYRLSVIRPSAGAVLVKNIAASSSKCHLKGNTLTYVSGNSGNWELTQFDVVSKSKKTLARLDDIVDIELSGRGFVLEGASGLWVSDYGREKLRVPFSYQLAGSYKGRALLKYGNTCYIIGMKKMTDLLDTLKHRAPELFGDTKPAASR